MGVSAPEADPSQLMPAHPFVGFKIIDPPWSKAAASGLEYIAQPIE